MKLAHNHPEMDDVCDCACSYYWHAISSGGICKGKWDNAGCQCDKFVLAYKIIRDITTNKGN